MLLATRFLFPSQSEPKHMVSLVIVHYACERYERLLICAHGCRELCNGNIVLVVGGSDSPPCCQGGMVLNLNHMRRK